MNKQKQPSMNFSTVLISLTFALSPAQVEAAVVHDQVSLEADTLQQSGSMVDWDYIEFHFLPGRFSQDITVSARNRGAYHSLRREGELEKRLPGSYRSKQQVVRYSITDSATNAIVEPEKVIVRLPYAGNKDRKRRLFYAANEHAQWQRIKTRVNIAEKYVQAELPSASGLLVIGGHTHKKEVPVKSTGYARYNGVPYSDTAAVIDVKSGKFLYREEAGKQRSIASVSKIMTSLVYLQSGTDSSASMTYSSAYDRIGAIAVLENGEQLTKRDVLMATLIKSANNMAVALANSTSLSEAAFIAEMNSTADRLNLHKTHFDEPSGLDSDNVSTAGNLARLARYAFMNYADTFEAAADTGTYTFSTLNTARTISLATTNKFNGRGLYELTAFKTGYLPGSAERTLVAQVQKIGTEEEVIIVLLGNPQYNTIFDEAYALADWAFNNWDFQNYAQ